MAIWKTREQCAETRQDEAAHVAVSAPAKMPHVGYLMLEGALDLLHIRVSEYVE
jgi:hypothetical protein